MLYLVVFFPIYMNFILVLSRSNDGVMQVFTFFMAMIMLVYVYAMVKLLSRITRLMKKIWAMMMFTSRSPISITWPNCWSALVALLLFWSLAKLAKNTKLPFLKIHQMDHFVWPTKCDEPFFTWAVTLLAFHPAIRVLGLVFNQHCNPGEVIYNHYFYTHQA